MTLIRKIRRVSKAMGLLSLLMIMAIIAGSCNFPPPTPTEVPPPAEEPGPAEPVDEPEPAEPVDEPEPEPPASELIPVDDTWNRYVNHALGFEMLVPTTMVHGHAGCYWNEANGDHSYRPQAGLVPVILLENDDRVYITSQSYSVLTGETEEDGRHFYSGCELVTNSLELVQDREFPNIFWEIIARPVESEDDLLALVHDVYGEACGLGEITPVEGEDYSSVQVLSDGLPMESSACVMNYAYTFYYHPELGRAVTWALGQAATFYADVNYATDPYDMQMLESFDFLADS